MAVFIIGITGAVGGLLAERLLQRGSTVRGLVRRADQQDALGQRGIDTHLGDLSTMSSEQLAAALTGAQTVVFTAGSNGGKRAVTDAIDGAGVSKAMEAAQRAGADRFVLVSVLPESWRERELSDDVEHYFAVKKQAEVTLTRSSLNWLILRPSLLVDDPGTGMISLGPAEPHHQIPRADVAATLAELLHEPHISRQILEVNTGLTPIADSVRRCVRHPSSP